MLQQVLPQNTVATQEFDMSEQMIYETRRLQLRYIKITSSSSVNCANGEKGDDFPSLKLWRGLFSA